MFARKYLSLINGRLLSNEWWITSGRSFSSKQLLSMGSAQAIAQFGGLTTRADSTPAFTSPYTLLEAGYIMPRMPQSEWHVTSIVLEIQLFIANHNPGRSL